ncbi:YPI1 [Candida theae]|uniref:Type 1 phosphatases regulator n=1 Tax=Candida theae TaxID=1198502 RepID=A0AAD5BHL1_9ASCO|nr:YPI1 [Candida theae]KAI5963996.1 YPI1 [Candida theae]
MSDLRELGTGSRTQVIEPTNNVLRLRPTEEREEQPHSQQHRSEDDGPTSVLQTSKTKTKTKSKQKKPRVRWTQDVVDNEHMNKKKTKICCIFHPQRSFDEEEAHDHEHDHGGHGCPSSSSDSSSDESDASDGESGAGGAGGAGGGNGKSKNGGGGGNVNAYEYQPKYENRSKLPSNPS